VRVHETPEPATTMSLCVAVSETAGDSDREELRRDDVITVDELTSVASSVAEVMTEVKSLNDRLIVGAMVCTSVRLGDSVQVSEDCGLETSVSELLAIVMGELVGLKVSKGVLVKV
jgi:hypothetical protein